MTARLRDGTEVRVAAGRPGAPPDRPEWMAPAASRLWVLIDGCWWPAIERRTVRELVDDLAVCDSWDEALALGVVGGPGVEAT